MMGARYRCPTTVENSALASCYGNGTEDVAANLSLLSYDCSFRLYRLYRPAADSAHLFHIRDVHNRNRRRTWVAMVHIIWAFCECDATQPYLTSLRGW